MALPPSDINLGLFVLRLAVGIVFLAHGPIKLLQPKVIAKGLSLSIPLTILVGSLETVGAGLLIFGVAEELGALMLGSVMLGAIYMKTQRWKKSFTGENGWELDFILLAAVVAILVAGGGAYGLL